jgi:hypothetical protein
MTRQEATIISAYTGVMFGNNFPDVCAYAEKLLGRKVEPWEFVKPSFCEQLKQEAEKDFLALKITEDK